MKTLAISILAVVMMTLGVGKAWAVCQPDDDDCYCRTHPGECDDAPVPSIDHQVVQQAAQARVHATMTTATPLGIDVGCAGDNTVGSSTCRVVMYFTYVSGQLSGGIICDVTVEMDGWGSLSISDIDCATASPPGGNGSCTGGSCG